MDDVKDKMKGFMKNLPPSSNSKFKGQGRVLGSSSSSSLSSNPPNSRLNPPPKPNPKPPSNGLNRPICSAPISSESEVSDHLDLCTPPIPNPNPNSPRSNGSTDAAGVAESVSLFLSGEPTRESVEVVLRLLSNVARDPGNEKFRRIRMGNPKIREAIGDVRGGVELLERVGFRVEEEGNGGEVWATMEVPGEEGLRVVSEAVSLLEMWKEGGGKLEGGGDSGEARRVVEKKKIDRQVRVFFSVSESAAANIDLPDSFYKLSTDEIRREAELRKKKIAESQLLIPKSYKEKQAVAARKKYKLTVIRVQFPDGVVLQGIFMPSEPTTALYEFVSSSLKQPGLEFMLLSPAVPKLRVIPRFTTVGDKRPPTLEEERLVPSALVKFKPIETDCVLFTGLTNELLEASEPLTSNTTVL